MDSRHGIIPLHVDTNAYISVMNRFWFSVRSIYTRWGNQLDYFTGIARYARNLPLPWKSAPSLKIRHCIFSSGGLTSSNPSVLMWVCMNSRRSVSSCDLTPSFTYERISLFSRKNDFTFTAILILLRQRPHTCRQRSSAFSNAISKSPRSECIWGVSSRIYLNITNYQVKVFTQTVFLFIVDESELSEVFSMEVS